LFLVEGLLQKQEIWFSWFVYASK